MYAYVNVLVGWYQALSEVLQSIVPVPSYLPIALQSQWVQEAFDNAPRNLFFYFWHQMRLQ
jgi:hypothetical protein